MTKKHDNRPGDKYNWWTLIEYHHKGRTDGEYWVARCKCGAESIKRVNALRRNQPFCCLKCWNKHFRKAHRKTGATNKVADNATLQWAVCPKCGRKHKVWLFWAGKGTPKKFCKECAVLAQKSELVYSLPPLWGGGRSAAI